MIEKGLYRAAPLGIGHPPWQNLLKLARLKTHLLIICLLTGWVLCNSAMAADSAKPAQKNNDNFEIYRQAFFIQSDDLSPPLSNDLRWQQLHLPDKWGSERTESGNPSGWYKIPLQYRKLQPDQAVYVTRTVQNSEIYFNGSFIGKTGSSIPPVTRNWNTPLLLSIPQGLWQLEGNNLFIRTVGYPGYVIQMPVTVGAYQQLYPIYKLRALLQNTVPMLFFSVVLCLSMFTFMLWYKRKHEGVYLWFSLLALFWSIYDLNQFIRDVPMPGHLWQWILYSAADWWMISMGLFASQFVQRGYQTMRKLYFCYGFIITFVYAFTPQEHLSLINALGHIPGVLIMFVAVVQIFNDWRRTHRMESALIGLGFTTVLVSVARDAYAVGARIDDVISSGLIYGAIAAPVVFSGIAWHLVSRFIHALNEADSLNKTLEVRIQQATSALEQIYDEKTAIEKKLATDIERERIYQDLHDDMGARLLTLVYEASDQRIADVARTALQDLRDVVSKSPQNETSIEMLYADIRGETSQRLNPLNIALQWQRPESFPEQNISSNTAVNIGRVIREVISNIIKHSEADQVILSTEVDKGFVYITIQDNGNGLPQLSIPSGRGTDNIRQRVEKLGGEVNWSNIEPHGCCVKFSISLMNT